jgi:GNAT superfamily N-acetyltransferase
LKSRLSKSHLTLSKKIKHPGYLSLKMEAGSLLVTYLDSLTPHWRSGVGTQLARAFEEWAAREGATLIALATRRATTFYLAIGFEESAAYFRKLL